MSARSCQHQLGLSCGMVFLTIALVGCSSCGGGAGRNDSSTPKQHTVSLSWKASSTPNVQYNIYRSTQHLGPYSRKLNPAPVSATTFTDSTVQSGATYYYVVTAVDQNSAESDYSNEATVDVPTS